MIRHYTTQSLAIRVARAEERIALEALQRRASLSNRNDREALLANPGAIQLPDADVAAGRVHVATLNGKVVGFSVVLPRGDGDADLDGLFVEPPHWRSGIGRALVERAERYARDLGASALHVVGNPHAEVFYRRVGFRITGATETQFGPGLQMQKPIRP